MNTLTTQHNVTINGHQFTIKGKHQYAYAQKSKMIFFLYLGTRGRSVYFGQLREAAEHLIKETAAQKVRDERHEYIKSMGTREKIAHKDFAYARFQFSSYGNYYNIYWRSSESPTGVEQVGGCDEKEWERLSTELGKSNQYLSPTEGRRQH